MISKIKTYLKTYLKTNYKRGQSQKWWRRENVEIRLEFFESLNGTTDFLLWNSEQGTGEWLLLRKWFGTFFTSKSLFSWMSVRVFLQGLYKGGEGEFLKMASPQKWLLPSKWLFPENGFSWEITSPQEIQNTSHFNLIWQLLRDFVQCEF